MADKNFSVTYYYTLKENIWPLGLENNYKKNEKICTFCQKNAKIRLKNAENAKILKC